MCSRWKDLKNCKCGVSKRCHKLYQDTVVGTCQDGAKWKKEGKKEKRSRTGHKMESELMTAIQAREPRQTVAAEGWITRKAPSVAHSTKAGRDPFSRSELGCMTEGLAGRNHVGPETDVGPLSSGG